MKIGAIADDFTGATDLAGNLVASGHRTVVVPDLESVSADSLREFDAVVVALKTRTAPVDWAVDACRSTAAMLVRLGAAQIYFKYCSTFDSTDHGNIGPVLDAIMDELDARIAIAVPSFPANGRQVFFGQLFVDGVLLESSPMRLHPLTPMTESHVPTLLARQSNADVELIAWPTVRLGSRAVRQRLRAPVDSATIYVIDAISDEDLAIIASAGKELTVISGGSGLGLALVGPSSTAQPAEPAKSTGLRIVLSGSLSLTTRAQIAHRERLAPSMAIDTERLLHDAVGELDRLVDWVQTSWRVSADAPLVFARASDFHHSTQSEEVGGRIEQLLGALALRLHELGASDFVVAGGETSGAVTQKLEVTVLAVGASISAGVSWMTGSTASGSTINLALKSGNFGSLDIFTTSWERLL